MGWVGDSGYKPGSGWAVLGATLEAGANWTEPDDEAFEEPDASSQGNTVRSYS